MRTWLIRHRRTLVVVVLLAVITSAAGVLRFDVAAAPSAYQSVDERAYGRLARNIARDGDFESKRMRDPLRWAPGAPAVFAAAHSLWPRVERIERWDIPSAYPVQAAAGTLLVPLVFALAALLAGPAAGLLAAAAIAFYPPLVDASGDLLTEPLGALALTVALIAVLLALRRESMAGSALVGLLAGALLGLTVLVRADLLLLPFGLAVVVALVLRSRRGALCGAAIALGAVVAMAPWSVHASNELGRFVPVSSGGASNLFVGTYVPGDGSMVGLKRKLGYPLDTPQAQVVDRVAERYARIEGIQGREPGDRDDALRAAASDNVDRYVLGDPLAAAAMGVRKVDRLWLSPTLGGYRDDGASTLAYHLILVAIGFLGLLGGLLARRAPGLWILLAVLGYVTAINVVLVSEARHNLPVMPVLVVAGIAGAATLLRRARDSGPLRLPGLARLRHGRVGEPGHPAEPA